MNTWLNCIKEDIKVLACPMRMPRLGTRKEIKNEEQANPG